MADPRLPAIYLRRSVEGGITKDDEVAGLRALAHREGHNGDVVEYDDWGHSADETKDSQDRLRDLIADMRADRVSVVYAGKLDRLTRSVSVFGRFAAAMKEHHVRLVTNEGDMSEDAADASPFAWFGRQMMVTIAEMELRTIKARVQRAQRIKRERGDRQGRAGYSWRNIKDSTGRIVREPDPTRPIEPILAAYRETGSVRAACHLLQEQGITPPRPCKPGCVKPHHKRGKSPCRPGCTTQHPHAGSTWAVSTLIRILEDAGIELPPRMVTARHPMRSKDAILAGLVRCACGRTMTTNRQRGQLYCSRGRDEGPALHAKYSVRQTIPVRELLPALQTEAEKFTRKLRLERKPTDPDARARLQRQLDNLEIRLDAGTINGTEYKARAQAIQAEIVKLDLAEKASIRLFADPLPDWTDPVQANQWMRHAWVCVQLDDQMVPHVEWAPGIPHDDAELTPEQEHELAMQDYDQPT